MSKVVWTEGEHVAYVLAKQSEGLGESDLGRWFLDASKVVIRLQKEGVQFRDALPDLSDDQCRHVVGMGDRFAVMMKNELGKEVKEGIERRARSILFLLFMQMNFTAEECSMVNLGARFALIARSDVNLMVMARELEEEHGLDRKKLYRVISEVDHLSEMIFGAESQE